MRLNSRHIKYVLLTGMVALGLGGCVAYPAPYYGGGGGYYAAPARAYYAAPAYYGPTVYLGGGGGRGHRHW